jgi:hypothetical protein
MHRMWRKKDPSSFVIFGYEGFTKLYFQYLRMSHDHFSPRAVCLAGLVVLTNHLTQTLCEPNGLMTAKVEFQKRKIMLKYSLLILKYLIPAVPTGL